MTSETGTGAAGDVERLEPWQLPLYLRRLEDTGLREVMWNNDLIALAEAHRRAASLPGTSAVVVDGTTIYVAEPDHSADDPLGVVPIQLGPRR